MPRGRRAKRASAPIMVADGEPDLSYCVVNTNGREYLLACLAAIERDQPAGLGRARSSSSTTPPTTARWRRCARAICPTAALIALRAPQGKAANDSACWGRAGPVLPAPERGLRAAARGRRGAARGARSRAAGRRRGRAAARPGGEPLPCAWRLPGVGTALAGALFLHRRLTVQSRGDADPGGRLGPVERADGPPRGRRGGRLPRPRFLRLLRRVRLLPAARAMPAGTPSTCPPPGVHHDQLANDLSSGLPRIVEFHRNRDLYMRKHGRRRRRWRCAG